MIKCYAIAWSRKKRMAKDYYKSESKSNFVFFFCFLKKIKIKVIFG